MQKHRLIALTISLVLFSLISSKTFASGTYRASSGGNDYHMAKLIFYKKITCDVCPYPGRGKNAQDAHALLQSLNENNTLSALEKRATKNYLKRRFKLN